MVNFIKKYYNSPPIILYRIGHFFHKIGCKKLGFFVSIINRIVFSTWIPSSAVIGGYFQVGYLGLGIVIHSDAVIGDNCLISQNVTIGKKNSSDKSPPILCDNIYVGTGSVLIGEIKIGENVTIGANSFVNKSISPNYVVAGNPFKIISKNKL